MSPPDTDLPASGASADRGADSMLQRALTLIEQSGALIFPLHHAIGGRCSCGNDGCKSVGKHPIERGWQRDASASELVVRAWWARHPHANIGLLAGQHAGIVVIDVDGAVGLESLRAIEARYGALPLTPRVITSRGIHLYFIYPSDATEGGVRNNASAIAPGIDVRGNGGYVVAPGSVHESGHVYAWVAGCELGAFPVAELPEWAMANDVLGLAPSPTLLPPPPTTPAVHPSVNGAARHDAYLRAALDRECNTLARSPEGARNTALNTAAFNLGLLVAGGELDADTVRSRLYPIAIRIGLGERETRKTIESGITRAAQKDARRVPPPTSSSVGDHGTRSRVVAAVNGHTPEPVGPPRPPSFECWGVERIFAPVPPMTWMVPELMIGPGRPTEIIAYGASGKTMVVQSLALAVASGTPVWGHFACEPRRVLHIDYEQGARDTHVRYQRLALGHGIDARQLSQHLTVTSMPRVYLTQPEAYDALCRVCDGNDLVIIDSFRAATPGADENDSKIRTYVDVMTQASEATGAALAFIHHSGKSALSERGGDSDSDGRGFGRGSSSIYDACGTVFNLSSGKTNDAPRRVIMKKTPSSARGGAIPPFLLSIVDVPANGDPFAGVAVHWEAANDGIGAAAAADNADYERDVGRLMGAVVAAPGSSQRGLIARVRMKAGRARSVLQGMESDGLITTSIGKRQTLTYWPIDTSGEPNNVGVK